MEWCKKRLKDLEKKLISEIRVGWNSELGTISASDDGGREKLRLSIDTFVVWICLCFVLFLKLLSMFYMVYEFDVLYFFCIENQMVQKV
jgi:hypothetical protein